MKKYKRKAHVKQAEEVSGGASGSQSLAPAQDAQTSHTIPEKRKAELGTLPPFIDLLEEKRQRVELSGGSP